MPPAFQNRQANRMIEAAIYQLKRQYGGGYLDIYKFNGETVDRRTGVTTVLKTLIQVRRAVILPARATREIIQTISKISADKQFVYGGSYDRSKRLFLIDRNDVDPTFELDEDDWLVYDGQKYEVKHFDIFEVGTMWAVLGQHVKGAIIEQIFPVCAEDRVTLTEGAVDA